MSFSASRTRDVRTNSQSSQKTVGSHRHGGEVIPAHPRRDEGNQRKPEQEVQVRPEDSAIDVLDRLHQVMVIVPVDAEMNKTEHITGQHRRQRLQRRPGGSVRYIELQHHDCDDDGEYTVAEGFHASLAHRQSSTT